VCALKGCCFCFKYACKCLSYILYLTGWNTIKHPSILLPDTMDKMDNYRSTFIVWIETFNLVGLKSWIGLTTRNFLITIVLLYAMLMVYENAGFLWLNCLLKKTVIALANTLNRDALCAYSLKHWSAVRESDSHVSAEVNM